MRSGASCVLGPDPEASQSPDLGEGSGAPAEDGCAFFGQRPTPAPRQALVALLLTLGAWIRGRRARA